MKHLFNLFILTLSLGFILTSCSDDDDGFVAEPLGDYEDGILIVGEGSSTTGTVTFVSEVENTVDTDVYANVNDEEVGLFFQSMGFNGNLAYLVVDNSNRILVVNRYTFENVATIITGLFTPRYITFLNGKGYVSNWGDVNVETDDFIAVIDLETNTVENTILVALGPEQLIPNGNSIYVSHKGAFGTNNIVSSINTTNNSITTITLDDRPDEMIINNSGNLVVLCEGATLFDSNFNVIGHTIGSLNTIDVSSNTLLSSLEFQDAEHPSLMTYNNGTLYYMLNNNLYSLQDNATSLPNESILEPQVGFAYGMEVNNNRLYVNDASFTEQSELKVYDLSTDAETNTYSVGLGASKIYFN